MPKRSETHVTADIAVARVMSIFTGLGWACQTVEHDYGEDVFVQPAINESVDPFRLWVQVKGTGDAKALRNKDGLLVWRVSHDHILRWVRSLERIIVVLWDIKTNQGYWTEPREEFTEWGCYQTKRKQASLLFNEAKVFDRVVANKLIWDARIEHYDLLVTHAKTMELRVIKDRKEDASAHPNFRNPVPTLAFDLLRLIDFIGSDGVSSQVRKRIEGIARQFVRENPKLDIRDAKGSSLLYVIVELINKKCPGLSISEDLLLEISPIAGMAIYATEAIELGDL
jgi:hypothetical protein